MCKTKGFLQNSSIKDSSVYFREPPNDEVMTFPRVSKTQVVKKAVNEHM